MLQPTPLRRRPTRLAGALGALTVSLAVLASCGGKSNSTATTATTEAAPPDTSAAPGTTATSTSSGTEPDATPTTNALGLPSINSFRDNPSDRFPVDFALVRSGHPYKGKNALTPHTGAHIHFDDSFAEWPQGGTAPENYPPIYAVADGVVSRVEPSYSNGDTDRYGVNLAIAASGSALIEFEYSIEPMVKEPSSGFYATFITVKKGDRVKKGDVIAYMYLPKDSPGAHIHFELINDATGDFMAPAIFDKVTFGEFYYNWKGRGFDSNGGYENPIPPCMGWKIDSSENPFENKAVDCLSVPNPSGA